MGSAATQLAPWEEAAQTAPAGDSMPWEEAAKKPSATSTAAPWEEAAQAKSAPTAPAGPSPVLPQAPIVPVPGHLSPEQLDRERQQGAAEGWMPQPKGVKPGPPRSSMPGGVPAVAAPVTPPFAAQAEPGPEAPRQPAPFENRAQNIPVSIPPAAPKPATGPAYDTGSLKGQPVQGLVNPGNIDVNHRPSIANDDGSHSSIFSITIPVDRDGSPWQGKYEEAPLYALIPSIADGKFLTPDGKIPPLANKDESKLSPADRKARQQQLIALEDTATAHYAKTGQHLGVFSSGDAADKYAGQTHTYMNDGTDRKVFTPSADTGSLNATPPKGGMGKAWDWARSLPTGLGGAKATFGDVFDQTAETLGKNTLNEPMLPAVVNLLDHLDRKFGPPPQTPDEHKQELIRQGVPAAEAERFKNMGARDPLREVIDAYKSADPQKVAEVKDRSLSVGNVLRGVSAGGRRVADGLSSPQNVAMLYALTESAVPRATRMLIDMGFAAEQAKQSVQAFKRGYEAYKKGDAITASEEWTAAPVDALFAFLTGAHLAGARSYEGAYGETGVRIGGDHVQAEVGRRRAYRAPGPGGSYSPEEGSTVVPAAINARIRIGNTQFSTDRGPQPVPPPVAQVSPTPRELTAGDVPRETAPEANQPRPPIGATEPETGRPVLQQSPHAEVSQAAATAEHPIVKSRLVDAIKPIDGAKVAGSRDEKDEDRLDEKIEAEGQSPRTVRDLSGFRISVDTPQARDQVVQALKQNFEVHSEQDNFTNGDAEHGFHAHTLNVREPGSPVSHEVQILPKEVADTAEDQHGLYEQARGGDEQAKAKLKELNQQRWNEFAERQGTGNREQGSEKPSDNISGPSETEPKYKHGNTQANIPNDSPASIAIDKFRATIPDADLAGDGKDVGSGGNHVTVRYGIKGDDTEGIRKFIESQAPFTARLGPTDVFPPSEHSDGAAVVTASIQSPELERLNAEIEKHGDFAESNFKDYKPHATIAYVDPAKAQQYKGRNLGAAEFPIIAISITDRNGNSVEVPLKGAAREPGAPPSATELEAAGQGSMFGPAEPEPTAPIEKLPSKLPEAQPGGVPAPGKVGSMPTADIHLDPQRFQYKLNTDASGVTNLLKGKKWNPDLAGVISVWTDPENGKTYAVNGHHRRQLAGENNVPAMNVLHIPAKTAEEARATAALQNIAEGRGTAIDAAKFLRDTGLTLADLEAKGISMGEATAANGVALSRLDPSLFDKVVNGQLRQNRAIAIGNATDKPEEQEAILSLIRKAEAKGRKVSDDTVDELARMVKGAGEHTDTQQNLFGAVEMKRNLALEKAEISAYIREQIGAAKRLWGSVSDQGKAEKLEAGGNKISAEKNAAKAQAATQAMEVYDRMSTRAGAVDDILNRAAKELAEGKGNGTAIKQRAYDDARKALQQTLTGGVGASAGGSEAQPATQPAPASPQSVTERFRAAVASRKAPESQVALAKLSVVQMPDGQVGVVEHPPVAVNGGLPRARVRLASGKLLESVKPEEMRAVKPATTAPPLPDKWVAFDFDGTLKKENGNEPIPAMVELAKKHLAAGDDVRILSAEVSPQLANPQQIAAATARIQAWTKQYLGEALPVTSDKADPKVFYDNHNVAVQTDTGKILGGQNAEDAVAGETGQAKAAQVSNGNQLAGAREPVRADVSAGRPAREPLSEHVSGRMGEPSAGDSDRGSGPTVYDAKPDTGAVAAEPRAPDAVRGEPAPAPRGIGNAELQERLLTKGRFTRELSAAKTRLSWENAGKAKLTATLLHDAPVQILNADAYETLRKVLTPDEEWLGVFMDRQGASSLIARLRSNESNLRPRPGMKPHADALRALTLALDQAREPDGSLTILRGDYDDATMREELAHRWEDKAGLRGSAAMRTVAERPEFARAYKKVQAIYPNLDREDMASEIVGKALAGDKDVEWTEAEQNGVVDAALRAAVDEVGPAALDSLPPVDPRVQKTLEEVRKYAQQTGRERRGVGEADREGTRTARGTEGNDVREAARTKPGGAGVQRGTEGGEAPEGAVARFKRAMKNRRLPGEQPLPGFGDAVAEQDEAAAEQKGRDLTAAMLEPKGDISRAAGKMERESPLFAGTDANPQGSLFKKGSGIRDQGSDEPSPTWYLKSEKLIDQKMRGPMTGDSLLRMLENNGVKPDELKWTGLEDLLKTKGKDAVRPEQVREYLAANNLQLKEVAKGDQVPVKTGTDVRPKFGSYTLPGGENYREMLITLPKSEVKAPPKLTALPAGYEVGHDASQPPERKYHILPPGQVHARPFEGRHATIEDATAAALLRLNGDAHRAAREAANKTSFMSSHWDEPNVLGHVRFNDRTGPNGEELLHLEELQSDWHEKGLAEGYGVTEAEKVALRKQAAELTKQYTAPISDEEREAYFTPGRVIRGYGGWDKVLKYHAPEPGAPYPKNIWSVEVVETNRDGTPKPYEKPRWHTTQPEASEVRGDLMAKIREIDTKLRTGVPDAPFKKTWSELLMKRMIRYAAENGYDGISWTPGDEQAKRYPGLQEVADKLQYDPAAKILHVYKNGRLQKSVPAEPRELPGMIGKGPTEKLLGSKIISRMEDRNDVKPVWPPDQVARWNQLIIERSLAGQDVNRLADVEARMDKLHAEMVDQTYAAQTGTPVHQIEGDDLKLGGEGMRKFYDDVPDKSSLNVVSAANKIGKQFGTKVGETNLPTGDEGVATTSERWARGMEDARVGEFYSATQSDPEYTFNKKDFEKWYADEYSGAGLAVPYLPIPDAMRQSVLHEGQPLFKKQTTATTGDHDTGKSLEDAIEDLAKLPKRKMTMAEHAEAGADMAIRGIADKGDALQRAWGGVKGTAAGAWQSWNAAQPMTDYLASLGDLREAELKAAMHVDAYQKELKRVAPSEKEREAMTLYGEAKDHAELTRWATLAAKDERFKRYRPAFDTALHLNPQQWAIADTHRRYYDQQLKILTDAGLLPAGASHYAMHMFASDPETLAKLQAATDFAELAPNPAFLKRRVYKSYFDAIAGGEKPKTMDAGKILSAYHDAFTKTFNTRAFVRSLLYGKADESRVYTELPSGFSVLERPNSTGKIEYFVQTPDGHVFDNKGQPKDEAIKQVIDRLNQESGSRPIAIMESRGGTAYVENTAAGKARIVKQPKRPLNVDDYVRIPASQLRNFTWELTDADREMLAPGYGKLSAEEQGKLFSPDDPKYPVPEGKMLAMQGDILIHPDYAGRVSDLVMRSWFDTESDHLPTNLLKGGIRAVKTVGATVKSTILYGSGFHQVQLGVHALDHWINPFKVEELKTMAKDPQVLEGVRHGLKMVDIDPEGVLSGLPGMGAYHRYLFRDWIPRLKAKAYKIIDDRNMHRYGGTVPGKEAKLTRDEIHLMSASQTNAAFSGQDPAFFRHLSFMNNRTFKAAEHLVMFSPDFTKARGQFVAQGFSKFGHEQRLALIRGALVMYATARIINAALNHDKGLKGAHWDPQDAFAVITPKAWGSAWGNKTISMRTVYGDIARLIQDPVGWSYNRLNPVTLRPTIEFMTGRDNFGRQETKEHFFKNYAKQSTPIPVQKLFTTSDEGFVEGFFTALGANMATYRTPLETEAYKLRIQGIPDKPQSEDKEDENRRNVQMVERVRDGRMTPADVWNQVSAGKLSAREAAAIVKRAGMTELQYNVNHLEFDDALTIWNKADAGEKAELKDVTEEKASRRLEAVAKDSGDDEAGKLEAKLIKIGVLDK